MMVAVRRPQRMWLREKRGTKGNQRGRGGEVVKGGLRGPGHSIFLEQWERFSSDVLDSVLGPTHLANLTVSLFLCSYGRSAQCESRVPCQLKSPSRVPVGDQGVARRNVRDNYFPHKGSLICPPGNSMILPTCSWYLISCYPPPWSFVHKLSTPFPYVLGGLTKNSRQ